MPTHRIKEGTFNNEGATKRPGKRKLHHPPAGKKTTVFIDPPATGRCISGCGHQRPLGGYPICNDCGKKNMAPRPTLPNTYTRSE